MPTWLVTCAETDGAALKAPTPVQRTNEALPPVHSKHRFDARGLPAPGPLCSQPPLLDLNHVSTAVKG